MNYSCYQPMKNGIYCHGSLKPVKVNMAREISFWEFL